MAQESNIKNLSVTGPMESLKKLWVFEEDFVYGVISSCFIATKEEISELNGIQIPMYDALGKHSNIVVDFMWKNIKEIPVSSSTIEELLEAQEDSKWPYLLCGTDVLGEAREIKNNG